jgi:cobalt-zinc-cadmium efflux system outer membrane protein
MSTRARARLACTALVLVCSSSAHAEPLTIDLPTAISRARERAPDAIAAAARIDEARAAGAGAGVWFEANPEVEVGAGRRFGDPATTPIEARLDQPLELGRRGARIRVADAGVHQAEAAAAAELRELGLAVTDAFLEARHADLVVEAGTRALELAERAADAADRRRKAGDITDLEVDLARVALGRTRSAVAAAQAARAAAIGRLAVLIGAGPDDEIALAGELRPGLLALDELRAAVDARADVRALDAEAATARAEGSLARASVRPEVGLWVAYERDETDTILLGGVRITLPFWNRAQGGRALARAKERRVELERGALVTTASRELVDAFAAYSRARESVEVFERDVLPSLVDAEGLLERSIDAGQIAVGDFLVARQELLDARRDELDRQLALAKAAAMARFVAGVAP